MISVSNKEWSERKLDINLANKCSQDNNFSSILSKLLILRKKKILLEQKKWVYQNLIKNMI